MDVYDNRETALWDLTEKEIEYLSQFSDLERKGDMKDLLEFLGIVESWNPMIRGENPLQFNIFEANGFNYTVNKILHKYLGFDKRIAKDFFFRRLHTITRQEFYNNELKKKDYYIRFEIDLWGGFSIDQLVPEMFKELEGVIDIKKIRYITIQAGSLNGTISENLFEHVPNVEAIHFEFNGPIAIPAGLLDTTTSVKEIGLINVSDLPFDVFKYTTQLTRVSINGDCCIEPLIFKHTPLLQHITMQNVRCLSKDLLRGLNIKYLYLNFCKFEAIPSLVQVGGISEMKDLRITRCQIPINKDTEKGCSIIDELVNKGSFPDLSLLEIWGNTPSTKAYNNLNSFFIRSKRKVRLILNLENDIDISYQIPLSSVDYEL
ncbi:MAG: hypothetical protein HeimC2_15180 [Candidatus Heimdallarchaeota archaeon LC_2]|nr:MAG: hypothetical protein HeimC2_15180 [Candidatus Heimdallarchaeota archaeon LC_2]